MDTQPYVACRDGLQCQRYGRDEAIPVENDVRREQHVDAPFVALHDEPKTGGLEDEAAKACPGHAYSRVPSAM